MSVKAIILFIVLCFLNSLYAYGQEQASANGTPGIKKYNWGLEADYFYSSYASNAISLNAALRINKHAFLMGPRIWIIPVKDDKEWSRNGVQFAYRFYPNSHDNRFNLYFFSIMAYNYIKSTQEEILYLNKEEYFSTYTITAQSMTANLGYGFEFMIVNGFYFNTSIAAGIGTVKRETQRIIREFPSASYSNYNDWSQVDFTAYLSFGFGYHFNKKQSRNDKVKPD